MIKEPTPTPIGSIISRIVTTTRTPLYASSDGTSVGAQIDEALLNYAGAQIDVEEIGIELSREAWRELSARLRKEY